MTTVELATRTNGTAEVALANAPAPGDALARLAQWVEAARNAHALVAPLVDTAFVPDAYKPKVDPRADQGVKNAAREVAVANATAAVLQGLSLGLDPLQALQNIYVVHGRPGMYAKAMVALVQAHGHEIGTDDLTDTRAVVWGRRKGAEHVERITVTMDQARKAGWTSNQAYTKTPQDMLWARAAARVCDRIAADVLKGITSVEQIRDEIRVDAEVGPATRTVAPRKRATAAAAITATEEPPLEPVLPSAHDLAMRARSDYDPTEDEPPAETVATITADQRATLTELLKATGRNGRTTAAKHISGLINRDITAATELTEAEANDVIESLRRDVASADQAAPAEPEQPELEP